jgi:hypothetical protein
MRVAQARCRDIDEVKNVAGRALPAPSVHCHHAYTPALCVCVFDSMRLAPLTRCAVKQLCRFIELTPEAARRSHLSILSEYAPCTAFLLLVSLLPFAFG